MKVPTSVFAGVTMTLFGLALVSFQLTVTDSMPEPIEAAVTRIVLPEIKVPGLPAQVAQAAEATTAGQISLRLPTPTSAPVLAEIDTLSAAASPRMDAMLDAPTANTNANLRSGPGTAYPIVGGVKTGDALQVSGSTTDGNWTSLSGGGWIASSLVNGGPGAGADTGLAGAMVAAARGASDSHSSWPRATLDDGIGFAYPPGWTADGQSGGRTSFANAHNPSQGVNVARSGGPSEGVDPFGVMSIVRNRFAADPRFVDGAGISFQIVTTGILELPGSPVFTSGLAYVAPEIPPVCIVMVEAPVGDEIVSLVFMDYANPDAAAEGLANLVPMVESLNYAASKE